MASISVPKDYPLPISIAEVILAKNPECILTKLENKGWVIEGKELLVYESWFTQTFPEHVAKGVFNRLFAFSDGVYKEKFDKLFMLADVRCRKVTHPLRFKTGVLIDELAERYGLHQIEIIEGLLSQMTDSLIRISPNIGKPKGK